VSIKQKQLQLPTKFSDMLQLHRATMMVMLVRQSTCLSNYKGEMQFHSKACSSSA